MVFLRLLGSRSVGIEVLVGRQNVLEKNRQHRCHQLLVALLEGALQQRRLRLRGKSLLAAVEKPAQQLLVGAYNEFAELGLRGLEALLRLAQKQVHVRLLQVLLPLGRLLVLHLCWLENVHH